MRIILLFCILTVLASRSVSAQVRNKITGPLAVYHISKDYIYADSMGTDSVPIQDLMRFGEICMPDQAFDFGFNFGPEIDSCISWHANKVLAIIQPPTEGGTYNQIADTALYAPFAQNDHPGMVQGGQRFSRLSQLYGPFCGVILDDWNGDTSVTRQVREAVQGKYVDANGNVHSETVATTPGNKLFTVLYSTDALPAAMPLIDGLYYSLGQTQNCCYTQIDSDIDILRVHFPHKEINIAVFLKNSAIGWADPVGVRYMLRHALDRYDNGEINQVNIFAGILMSKEYNSLARWDSLALPQFLDTFYFPYLGEGMGRVYDCNSGNALPDAFVRVYCVGRLTGDTLMRSRQKTDAEGRYECGLWAGNRNSDSTYHWLIAEKAGYVTDTVGFWIRRGDTTSIPDVSLCPGINGSSTDLLIYPSPSSGLLIMKIEAQAIGGDLEIYDMLGRKVFSKQDIQALSNIDVSELPDGIYYGVIRTVQSKVSQRSALVVRH